MNLRHLKPLLPPHPSSSRSSHRILIKKPPIWVVFLSQKIRKPGSVLADHLSSLTVASKIKRINCDGL
jgi:hypothetical protein